jgi:hypothetical protein
MGGLERAADLRGDPECGRRPQPLALQDGVERLARHVFHGDEAAGFRFAELVHDGDVRVCQGGQGLCFAAEAGAAVGMRAEFVIDNFDGDVAVEREVAGAVDLAHPARPEQPDDFVGPESGPDRQAHALGRL